MPVYSVAASPSAPATGAAYCTFHTGSSRRAFIREIHAWCSAATQSDVGLIRPNNTPVATTSIVPVALDAADAASTATLDTTWSTAPTIGSNVYLKKANLGNVQGAAVIWSFQRDGFLVLAKSDWIVLWNYGASTAAACDFTIVYEE